MDVLEQSQFEIGSQLFWFWALLIVEIIALFVFFTREHGTLATISLVIFAGLFNGLAGVPVFRYIQHNPMQIVALFFIYFAVGAVWSLVKWTKFVMTEHAHYTRIKTAWFEEQVRGRQGSTKEEFVEEWERGSPSGSRYTGIDLSGACNHKKPIAKDHKSRILRWIGFWWLSMLCTIGHDFLYAIVTAIYDYLTSTFQRISDRIYSDTE